MVCWPWAPCGLDVKCMGGVNRNNDSGPRIRLPWLVVEYGVHTACSAAGNPTLYRSVDGPLGGVNIPCTSYSSIWHAGIPRNISTGSCAGTNLGGSHTNPYESTLCVLLRIPFVTFCSRCMLFLKYIYIHNVLSAT
jgi:hypothetical protein